MKHAVIITAHGNLCILQKCMEILDSHYFDFYIHIDAKSHDNGLWLKECCKQSNVFFTKRIPVYWGHHSQVAATLLLLEHATSNSIHYDYYHFLSGSCMPLKTPADLDRFFTLHAGSEFVTIRGTSAQCGWRMRYRYPLLTLYKATPYPFLNNIQKLFYTRILRFPRRPGTDILRDKKQTIYMGDNWFSITHALACRILSLGNDVFPYWEDCYVSDETFVQTLIMDMPEFSKKRSDFKTRAIDWGRGRPYTWQMDDLEFLLHCESLFARKFSTSDFGVVEALYGILMQRKTE